MKGLRLISQLVASFGPTDEQLMERAGTSDDPAPFETLVNRWRPRIHHLCGRMLGDPALGEDIAQAVFARIHEHRTHYRPSARFSTYLWRVAVNLCHDEIRRRNTRAWWLTTGQGNAGTPDGPESSPPDPLDALPDPGPAPDTNLAQVEEGEFVRRALLRLPAPLRTVVVLRHYQDLKLREIAEVLEIPEGTVNSRMAEALTQLARQLSPVLKGTPHTMPAPPVPLTSRPRLTP